MDELGTDRGALLAFDLGQESDGSPLLTLTGELDMTNAGELEAAVAPVIAGSPERLIVDVKDLQFADSSAIALLVKWANVVPRVELRQPPELLNRIIARMGLAERLHVKS